jgi:uncharacterized protein (UPF0276 family)
MPHVGPRPIPACAGIGLRAIHHETFLSQRPAIAWVEVHSENFFADGGRQIEVLETVRRDYAVSLHGVGLSLGSTDALDAGHLRRLKRLIDRTDPSLVSEHLSWSSAGGVFLNDLLPLPRTAEALAHVVRKIIQVQEYLGRQILIENVSSYLAFADDQMSEWEFLVQAARRSGCLVLLDVNNIYVNARNHGFDPLQFIGAVPPQLVAEMHIAGYSVVERDHEQILVDTHDAPVSMEVWALYDAAVSRFGRVPTLLEWDSRLPPLDSLVAQARQADERMESDHVRVA